MTLRTVDRVTRDGRVYRPLWGHVVPSDPRDSPSMRILSAWLEYAPDVPYEWIQRALDVEFDPHTEAPPRFRAPLGRFQTVVKTETAYAEGRRAIDEFLPEHRRQQLNEQVVMLGRAPVEVLLGYIDRDGKFQKGLAGLTEQQANAFRLRLLRYSEREIAELMDRKRASKKGLTSLPLATVDDYLSQAWRSVRKFFGVSYRSAAA